MEANGFTVQVEDSSNLAAIRSRYQVPASLQSCHTAIVNGYVIEGHVPAEDVQRLLEEQPDVIGLAVPGMPAGSPGMEMPDGAVQPYDVIAFDQSGPAYVFASYGP